MLPVSGNAHAAPSAAADSQDDDFQAVLASYVNDAKGTQDVVPRDAQAVKAVKAIDRIDAIKGQTKADKKDAHAEDKAPVKDDVSDAQPVPDDLSLLAVQLPAVQDTSVRTVIALQQPSNDDDQDADDTLESVPAATGNTDIARTAVANAPAIASLKANLPQAAMPTLANPATDISRNDQPKVAAEASRVDFQKAVVEAAHSDQQKPAIDVVRTDQQKPSASPLPKAVMDQLVTSVKTERAQEPAPNAAPQSSQNTLQQRTPSTAPQSASNAAPQRPQSLMANILTMLNAARGTITVNAPAKPVVAANSDVKAKPAIAANSDMKAEPTITADSDVKSDTTGKAPRAAQTVAPQQQLDQKPVANDKVVLNTRSNVRNPAQDTNDQPTDTSVKASPVAAEPAQPTAPQSVSQTVAPTNQQVVAAVTPNAVNATAATSAKAAPQRPASNDAQGADQPKIAALATAIAAKSAAGTKTFDIRMDPPELGRVDVHLSVDRDGKVQAMLSAEHPQTLELLQRDSQHLERALKDAGLDLSNNSLNFSLKGDGRQGDGGGASTARARSMPNAVVARAEAANASASNFNYASGNGRLDIRV